MNGIADSFTRPVEVSLNIIFKTDVNETFSSFVHHIEVVEAVASLLNFKRQLLDDIRTTT